MMMTELRAAVSCTTDTAGQALGSLWPDSAADENQIQECMDWDWRQENWHSSPRMPTMKEESMAPVVPQL